MVHKASGMTRVMDAAGLILLPTNVNGEPMYEQAVKSRLLRNRMYRQHCGSILAHELPASVLARNKAMLPKLPRATCLLIMEAAVVEAPNPLDCSGWIVSYDSTWLGAIRGIDPELLQKTFRN